MRHVVDGEDVSDRMEGPVQPWAFALPPTTPRLAAPPPGLPSAMWPMSYLLAPMIWPMTIRVRLSVPPVQDGGAV